MCTLDTPTSSIEKVQGVVSLEASSARPDSSMSSRRRCTAPRLARAAVDAVQSGSSTKTLLIACLWNGDERDGGLQGSVGSRGT